MITQRRAKVLAACKANHIFFLNTMTPKNMVDMIKEGVMVGPASQRPPRSAQIHQAADALVELSLCSGFRAYASHKGLI